MTMIDFRISHAIFGGLTLIALLFPGKSGAQTPTKEDSGWVAIFNGTDFDNGFYVYKSKYVDVKNQTSFKVENGTIHATDSYTLLITTKEYSYYKVRVDSHFKVGQTGGNAGLMILMDNTAAKT